MSTFIFTYVFLSNGINIIRNLIIMFFFVVQPFANVESLLHIMFLLRNSFCKCGKELVIHPYLKRKYREIYLKCELRILTLNVSKEKVSRDPFKGRSQGWDLFKCGNWKSYLFIL